MWIDNLHKVSLTFAAGALLLIQGQAIAQPSNDNCANATTLSVNASCTNGVTNAGTLETGELTTCLGTGIDQTVWYKFIATAIKMDVIILGNSANKCYFGSAIWDSTTSPCPVTTGAPLSCEDKAGGPLSQKHELTNLTVGNTYLVQIGYNEGSSCGSSVSFCIGVYDNEVSSDACANAANVSTYNAYTVSNAEVTPDKDLCSGSTENNIWFKWVVPSWWTPGALAYVHLYGQKCDNSAGMQLSIFKKDNCGLIPNPASGGSPPANYGDCIFWANTQTTADIQYSWPANPGEIFYFDLDGYAGTACVFTFMVSPYVCFTATATTTTAAPCPPATGGTATVTPSGVNSPFTYLWSNGQTTQTASGLTANTTYSVTVTDNVGCAVVTSATVPGPAVAGFTTSGSFCTVGTGGTGVIFTNTGTTGVGTTYVWTFPSGTPATSTAENPTVTWAAAATYSITQQVTKDGCTQTSTKNVTILDCTCPLTVNAGTDFVICDNTTSSLSGSYTNVTNPAVYYLNDNFDTYADNAAFEASWTVFESNADQQCNLTTTQYVSAGKSINLFCAVQAGGPKYAEMKKSFTAISRGTAECNARSSGGTLYAIRLQQGTTFKARIYFDFFQNELIYDNNGTESVLMNYTSNQWYNIKLNFDAVANTCAIFVDGILKYTSTLANPGTTTVDTWITRTDNVVIFDGYVDDVKVYQQTVTVLWTPSTYLSSTSVLNPTFTPPIVASPTNYTYTLCIVDDCSGACPNSKVDAVTVTVNHCCNLTVDAASNDDNNDTTFNRCTQPTLVMAGAYANEQTAPTTIISSGTLNSPIADATGTGCGTAATTDFILNNPTAGLTLTKVCLSINHTYNADLDIFIRNPSGVQVELSTDNGGSGDNYTNVCFYMTAPANIITAPTTGITGDWIPEGNISTYDPAQSSGNWVLRIIDDCKLELGTLVSWSMTFTAPPITITQTWTAGASNPGYPATGLSSTTVLTPTFTPTAAGNYFFTLSVTDACGTATDNMLIIITSNVCAATFSVNDTSQELGDYPVAPYNTFNFLNTGSTGSPWTFTWNMGGTGTYLNSSTSTSENPDYTYAATGTYTVTHTVSMPLTGSCSATSCSSTMTVDVTLPPCIAANRKYYRSIASGNWNALTTWQFSCDAGVTDPWIAATLVPDYTKQTITIQSPHIVTITTDVTIDQVIINAGGTLIYNGGTLTINNGNGIDLLINGTFEDNGPNAIGW